MKDERIPCNIGAEQGVLGSIIIDPEAIVQVIDTLHADDFYRDAHRTIYRAMCDLYAEHEPADSITLCDALERAGKLKEVGGASHVMELANDVPTSGNVAYYASIVGRAATCRRFIHVAGQIAGLAYSQDEQMIEKAEKLVLSVERHGMQSGFISMSTLMLDYLNEIDFLHKNRHAVIGVPTGYDDIDDVLGGMQKTDLLILAGRPGMGKTACGVNIARNAAGKEKRVAVFSLEMGNRQLARRLMAMESGIDMQRLRKGWIRDEWDVVYNAGSRLSNLPIWFNDTAGNPVASMRSQLRRLVQDAGSIDLVVVDYLQLIEPDEDGKSHENRVQEISMISRGLKGIAKEFDVPVLALAQLSRKVEERQNKRPQLSDLKESGAIEENADVVMFVYRDDYYAEMEQRASQKPGIAEIIIAKHRNGPTGDIELHFKADQTKFYPVEARNE